jgi:hypothetical protein
MTDFVFSWYHHVLPKYITKLPASMQLFLFLAVAAHVIAVVVMIIVHSTGKKTPDFKGKIK